MAGASGNRTQPDSFEPAAVLKTVASTRNTAAPAIDEIR